MTNQTTGVKKFLTKADKSFRNNTLRNTGTKLYAQSMIRKINKDMTIDYLSKETKISKTARRFAAHQLKL